MDKRLIAWLKKTLSVLLLIGIFSFFAISLHKSWNSLGDYGFSWGYAALLAFASLCSILFSAVVYFVILRAMKINVTLTESISSHAIGDFSSYLPGRVWNVLVRWRIIKDKMRLADSVVAITIEAVLLIISAMIVFFLGVFFDKTLFLKYAWLVYVSLPLLILLIHPKVLSFFMNIALRILKKKPIIINIKLKDMALTALICIAYWAVYGFTLFFAIASIYPIGFAMIPKVLIANASSWVIGFLAALTPAGLGVKEGLTVLLLSSSVPKAQLIASTVFARIVFMLVHFCFVAICVAWLIKSHKFKNIKSLFSKEDDAMAKKEGIGTRRKE